MDKENLEDKNKKIYHAKDILDAAVRANVKIEQIEESAALLEGTKGREGKDEVR